MPDLTRALRRWWPVPALAGGLLAGGMVAGRPDDPEYYRSLKQAPFAPPPWAFGPAWTVAKLGSSLATVRAARGVRGPDRSRLAVLAAADAAVYVTFSYVYFRRRSIGLAAVWTVADAAVTAAALPLLARHDRAAAAALAPQAAWLAVATPTALYQARANA
jgi:tryptophan-rich sensory protein